AAARQFAEAIAAQAPTQDERWWDRLARARLTMGLGRARRQAGELRGAREAIEKAIADLDGIVRMHPTASNERRLGRARVELALTLLAMKAPPARRRVVAMDAIRWLQRVGGFPPEIAELSRGL